MKTNPTERAESHVSRALSREAVDDRGDAGTGHQHQHAGGVGAALGADVGVEDPGHEQVDDREQQHQRPNGPGPLRRHAVARQILRHEVSSPAMALAPANQRITTVLMS